ncbi:MAG: SIMPL domain-containing protein [Leptolyngbya sp. BL-A-14]
MKRRQPFAVLSLLSTFAALSLGIVQPAKAEGAAVREQTLAEQTIAKQPAVMNCTPTNTTATANKPDSCVEPMVERRSLTVIGLGQVTAPADVALLEFLFGGQMGVESTAPGLSIETARKAAENALQPVVKALTAMGIPSRNITLRTNSLQSPKLLVRVEKPTQEGLQKTVLTVNQALKSNQSFFLQSIGAGYAVNSCQTLQRSARRLALSDAQEQLTSLAQDVKVQMGELLSVTVQPLEGSPNSTGCGSKVGVPNSPVPNLPVPIAIDETTPPYDPSAQPTVQVRSKVSVTRAIVP